MDQGEEVDESYIMPPAQPLPLENKLFEEYYVVSCQFLLSEGKMSEILPFLYNQYFNWFKNAFVSSSICITGYFFILLTKTSGFSKNHMKWKLAVVDNMWDMTYCNVFCLNCYMFTLRQNPVLSFFSIYPF